MTFRTIMRTSVNKPFLSEWPRARHALAALAGGAILIVLLQTGCSSPPATGTQPTAPAPARAAKSRADSLVVGMSPDQARAIMGKPAEVRPTPSPDNQSAEVWVYPLPTLTKVRTVQTGSRDVPVLDLTGANPTTIQEPIYTQESVTIVQELHLLWFNGGLVTWRQVNREGSHNFP